MFQTQNLDVACLQEVGGGIFSKTRSSSKKRFAEATGLTHYVTWYGCGIYSRFELKQVL